MAMVNCHIWWYLNDLMGILFHFCWKTNGKLRRWEWNEWKNRMNIQTKQNKNTKNHHHQPEQNFSAERERETESNTHFNPLSYSIRNYIEKRRKIWYLIQNCDAITSVDFNLLSLCTIVHSLCSSQKYSSMWVKLLFFTLLVSSEIPTIRIFMFITQSHLGVICNPLVHSFKMLINKSHCNWQLYIINCEFEMWTIFDEQVKCVWIA